MRASFSIVLSSAALVTVGAFSISSPEAATVDPANYSISFGGVPGAVDASGPSPHSGSYVFFGGTLDVNAAAATTAQPAASANVVSGGCTSGFPGSGCAGGGYGDTAVVEYHIDVIGPADVMVPYYFNTAGGVTVAGQYGEGSAEVSLIAPGGVGLLGFVAATFTSDVVSSCGADGCVNSTQYVSLLSDNQYTVEVSAAVSASTNFASSVLAWADPYIYIDPAFVDGDQFTLLISPGIGNSPTSGIPEPSTWAMILTGFASLGWFARQRGASKRLTV